jgi:Bacterial Ig-like domain (group 2)/Divergent InlB B-repeat domain
MNPVTGTITSTADSNAAGTITIEGTDNGTFSLATNGRELVTFPNHTLIVYLSRPGHGFEMVADNGVADPAFGTVDLQTGGPFSDASIATNYFFGDREQAAPEGGSVVSGVTTLSGSTLNTTFDNSHADGRLDYADSGTLGVSVAPNGRFLYTNNNNNLEINQNEVGYVITPSHVIFTDFDPTNSHPSLHEAEGINMPAGVPIGSPNPFPSFGTVQVGNNLTSATTFVLTNNSDGLLSITGISNPADFSALSGTCVSASAVVVLPHSSCNAMLNFKPTTTGTLTEDITFQTDGGNLMVAVTGMGSAGAPVTVSVDISANNTSGGTIVDNSTPPLINCTTNGTGLQSGTCSASYADGASVTFTETPGAGVAFSGWNGPCGTGTGGTNTTCTITVTNPTGAIDATYTNGSAGPFTLAIALPTNTSASTGNGIVGVATPATGISCTFAGAATPTGACSNAAEKDGEVIQVNPLANDDSTFGGWAGTCPFQTPSFPNDCFVTMSQSQTLTPVFTIKQVTVSVTVNGVGSVVDNSTPLKINCVNTSATTPLVCSASYPSGTTITLTATPGTGYSLTSFSACTPNTTPSCSITLNAASTQTVNVVSTFTIETFVLNVSTKGGNGTGTVTSNPNYMQGTIGCGPNNQPPTGCGLVEQFGAVVMLTETPTAPTTGTTNAFTGWSASGVPGFTLPASCTTGAPSSCTFSMPVVPPSATFLVTATFTETFQLMVTDQGPGGKVTSQTGLTPAINCVSGSTVGCSAFYNAGQAVTLTAATTGSGSTFTGWSGAACSGVTAPTCALTMTQPLDVTATFTSTGGTATHFAVSAPSTVTSGSSFSFTVTALTASNTTATGYSGTVHFTSSDSGATLPANSTLINGVDTFTATLKNPGSQTITATDAVTASITGSATITVTATPDFTLSATPPSQTVTAGSSTTYTVNLSSLNSFSGGVALTVSGLPTGAAGQFSVTPVQVGQTPATSTLTVATATITPAGTSTLTITGTSGSLSHTATVQLTVSAPAAPHFAVAAPATAVSGTPFTFTVTALTASGTTVTGYTGTVHFTSSDAAATLPANYTFTAADSGVHVFSATLKKAGSQTITATDTVTAAITGTSNPIVVSAGPATHFSITAPATADSGTSFNFTVTALDAGNNTATGYTGTVQFSSSDGSAILPTPSTLTKGVGMFPATLNVLGSQTITATDNANELSGSATVNVIGLKSIAVTPANPTIQVGSQQQFTATGTFTDGSTQNITNSVTWSASNTEPVVASITSGGLATALAAGTTTIAANATAQEIIGSTTLTVTNAPFTLTLVPPPGGSPAGGPTVPPGSTLSFGILLVGQPGFSGTIQFSCSVTSALPSVNASQFIRCQPAPGQATLVAGQTTQEAIVLDTFCSDAPPVGRNPLGPGGGIGLLLAAILMGGSAFVYRRKPRWALTFAVITLIALGTAACGNPNAGPNGRTPPGPYNVMLNASFKGQNAQLVIPFNVQ